MYDNHRRLRPTQLSICTCLFASVLMATGYTTARAQDLQSASIVRKISGLSDKMELTTNTSRILTMDKNIPRVQVNNPELLAVTPLSATQVQISAKKAGVTQVNLWDDEGKVHTVDVMIYGDVRELEAALKTQFPYASIKVYRYSESLMLTGFVDRPDHVSPIMQLAADYSPKVINNVQVGGVQQVLLKVKVMEMSRTKLRRMSTDFTVLGGNGSFFSTGVSGLLSNTSNGIGGVQSVVDSAGKAAEFGIVHNNGAFFGFLDWAQQNNIARILSEPNIMAVSGRPAQFNVGGETPILVPQSLGTVSIEYKPFGTQIDFLPIVLGNGNIRLEVRPRISDLDQSIGVVTQNLTIPGFRVRQVDTAVEMKAGQTFALAGLVQERTESQKRGLPYISDMPIIGLPFRKVEDVTNEIELLIVVTPEFVDPIDACEAPCDGPGMFTTSPTNRGLYCGAYMEVPTYCNPTSGLTSCGQDPCARCSGGGCLAGGCNSGGCSTCNGAPAMNGAVQGMTISPNSMPGGTGYDDSGSPTTVLPTPDSSGEVRISSPPEASNSPTPTPAPQDISLPENAPAAKASKPVVESKPAAKPVLPPQPSPTAPTEPVLPKPSQAPPTAPAVDPGPSAGYEPIQSSSSYTAQTQAIMPRYTPQRQPVFMRNASRPNNPQGQQAQPSQPRDTSLIGPVGYDIQQ